MEVHLPLRKLTWKRRARASNDALQVEVEDTGSLKRPTSIDEGGFFCNKKNQNYYRPVWMVSRPAGTNEYPCVECPGIREYQDIPNAATLLAALQPRDYFSD
ncbi:hypothetical protein ACOSQ3_002993 [Xanthoceras sorbifolium]